MKDILFDKDGAHLVAADKRISFLQLATILESLYSEIKFGRLEKILTANNGNHLFLRDLSAGADALRLVAAGGVSKGPYIHPGEVDDIDWEDIAGETVEDEWIFPGSTTAPSFCVG